MEIKILDMITKPAHNSRRSFFYRSSQSWGMRELYGFF